MISAFQEVLPEKITADSASEMLILQFGGRHKDGKGCVIGELIASGSGAGKYIDGVDVIETDATNCMNLPVEALELEAPIGVFQYRNFHCFTYYIPPVSEAVLCPVGGICTLRRIGDTT